MSPEKPVDEIVKAINGSPEAKAWAKEYDRLREKMKTLTRAFGGKVRVGPDFDNNNTHEDALNALARRGRAHRHIFIKIWPLISAYS